MQDAGWKQYPIVYRDEKVSLSDNGLLVGYQYTLEKGGIDQVSLMIVRNVPRRDIETAITEDQKSSFYPLHPDLKGQAVDLREIEQTIPKRIAALSNTHSFTKPSDSPSDNKPSDSPPDNKASSSSSTSTPSSSSSDNEALERFYQSFSRSFIQPNVRTLLKTTFNQYLVAEKNTSFDLNATMEILGWLRLDAGHKKRFDLYFVK